MFNLYTRFMKNLSVGILGQEKKEKALIVDEHAKVLLLSGLFYFLGDGVSAFIPKA